MKMGFFEHSGVGIHNLGERQMIIGTVLAAYHLILFRKPLRCMSKEFIIVIERHSHIGIIVPGDKALVTHSSKHRASYKKIPQSLFTTHLVERLNYAEHFLLHTAHIIFRF